MKRILLMVGVVSLWSAHTQVINTFPYNQNFEGEGASTACNGYTMLSPGWSNDVTDVNDWVPDANGTTSSNTGPSMDYNPGTTTGKYMYTETSGCQNDIRNLNTPWFDFTGGLNWEMNFAYHMWGGTMGTMAVSYRTGLIDPWTVLVAPFTDNQNLWQISITDVSFLAGNDSVQFRIIAATGTSFESDMAIDDFNVIQTIFSASIAEHQDITCFGAGDGMLTAAPVYGNPPFLYAWDNGATTATISGLGVGNYCCTITDNLGQTSVVCADILQEATSPLSVSADAVDPWICKDSTGMLVIDEISGGVNVTLVLPSELSTYACTSVVDSISVNTTTTSVNTTTSYPCPLGNYYWGNREQFLYRATELNAIGVQPGNIYGIAFFVQSTGTSTLTLNNWTIKMGPTTANNTLAWNDTACVEVLAPGTITIATGWNWFAFDTPFYWNGTDNLLIETCQNNSSFTENVIQTHTTPDPVNASSIYYRADLSTVCGTSTITGTSTLRPVTVFSNCFVDNSPSYDYIYSWNNGSVNDSTEVTGGTYLLTVTDSVGCMVQQTVTIDESQPVNIDDLLICATNPTPFDATPGFNNYMWNTGEITSSISIATGGVYYVDATDSLGCKTSDTAFVSTLAPPVLAASPSPETFGSDGAIYLSIYSTSYPFIIDWDNDGTGDNDDNENIFYLTAGDYTVLVTDVNGCYTELTVTVESQLGVDELGESAFSVFPNPTAGTLYIQTTQKMGEVIMGQVTDASGRVIHSFSFQDSNVFMLDLSGEESGIYFIQLNQGDNQQTLRAIKE